MDIPISFNELGFLIAELSIITMALSVLVSKYYSDVELIIDRSRLRRVSIALLLPFAVVFLYQLYEIIISIV